MKVMFVFKHIDQKPFCNHKIHFKLISVCNEMFMKGQNHLSPIDAKSPVACLTSETSAVVCLGLAQTGRWGIFPHTSKKLNAVAMTTAVDHGKMVSEPSEPCLEHPSRRTGSSTEDLILPGLKCNTYKHLQKAWN